MSKNEGKIFEQQFQKSCIKQNICCIRLIDSNKFGVHTESRFTPDNICDYICFDGTILMLLELKHTKGTSISFNQPALEDNKGTYMIKPKQVRSLLKYTGYPNVICGLVLDFGDRQTKTQSIEGGAYFIEINDFVNWTSSIDKKSINQEDAASIGIKIDRKLKKVNYEYDIEKMVNDIVQNVV